ncbi:hypothetical protein ACFPES_18105 [Paenibacillus sp. GCM10023248]|uniref:hypothetical protein n=1 Tax=unclassified Paenibacillus TaxID=185978 RepID=UPI002379EC0E|nr:hypothetical protein [Paenibacillus sp. MAHUQ-63]MDD9268959.1 hypothetical protein [Paenibacillus sp. MAHUQ-63]
MLIGICVFVITALIACYEIPRLWRQGCKQEIWIYSSLMLLGNVLATMKGMHKTLPNPADWVTFLMMPITKLLLQIGLITK